MTDKQRLPLWIEIAFWKSVIFAVGLLAWVAFDIHHRIVFANLAVIPLLAMRFVTRLYRSRK